MKKLFLTLIFIFGNLTSSLADFNQAEAAYKTADYTTALTEYEKAATQGDKYAQYYLALQYMDGIGTPQNYKSALKWFQKAADQSIIEANLNIGNFYVDGKGVPQDTAKGIPYLQKAADKNNPDAQFNLAILADQAKDYTTAFKLYKSAADNNLGKAQLNLAGLYYNGLGVKQDREKAYYYLHLAAKNNARKAKKIKAAVGINFKITQRNRLSKSADEWFNENVTHKTKYIGRTLFPSRKQAMQDFKIAYQLVGQDDAASIAKAVKIYTSSAQANYGPAQYSLANLYINNDSPDITAETAYFYALLAEKNHVRGSFELRALIAKQLKLKQLKAIAKQVSEWPTR